MGNPVVYVEMGGRNAAGLKDFYSELFGWNINAFGSASAAGADYWHIEADEGGVPGGIIQTNENMPPNYVMFYVQTDDLQAALDKAESLGGTPVVPPTDIPGGTGQIAVFIDPDGNGIGLHKFNEGAAPEQA